MKFPLPLRFTIPATLFLFGVLLGGLSLTYELTSSFNRIEEDVNRRAIFLGNQVSGVLEYELINGDTNAVALEMTLLSANPNLKTALVCDEENNILFASDRTLPGKTIREASLQHAQQTIYTVRKKMRIESAFTENRKTLLAAFPFKLPAPPEDTRPFRPGVLYLQYDLTLLKDSEQTDAIQRSVIVGSILAIVVLLIWGFFDRTLTRRVRKLLASTQRLAKGEFSPANLSGSDELAELAKAFDQMAENIRRHTAELELANKKMKREIAERELAENRFLSVWKSSVDGMRLTDQHGNVIAVNDAYCRMVGMSVEELEGRPFSICYKSDDNENILDTYRTRFANRSIETFLARPVEFRSGKSAELEVASSFIAQDNDEPLLLSIFRDVTARKRAKELLDQQAASMKASLDGMAILDPEGRFVYLNDAHAKIYGHDSPEELIGNTWEVLYERNELCRFKEYIMPSLFKTGHWRGEAVGRKRDGTTFPQEISLSRMETGGLVCVVRDITERKLEEERRLAIDRKLLDAQKLESLGVLAGGIAHDFNNLLTAILGNASLALMRAPEAYPIRNYLTNIEKTSMQAADLCKQMLAYSGRGKFVVHRIDVNSLILDMQQLLHISVHKRVELKYNLSPNLPAIEADPSQIRQIIMNLVINASEAIGDKDGSVIVKTSRSDLDRYFFGDAIFAPDLPSGDYIVIEVTDTGCGMSAETRAKIFEPFFTTKFTGRGLGLAAVLGIVRGHKGAIKVTSEPGRGSTFHCVIPCAEAPAEELNRDTPSPVSWRGKGTILVVDDEETVRAVTSQMLESFGFETLTAGDGREGVQVLAQNANRVSAVVLDMTMPHMNGEEAFREMRRIRADVPVILVSGYNEQDATNRFAGKGLSGFVQKPFKIEDLRNKLRTVLEREAASAPVVDA